MQSEGEPVCARIVYWGIPGAGVSASLRAIHSKLRAENRGALQELPTSLDPTVSYELLQINLGEVGGVPTEIQVIGVPGGPSQAATRKQLLDRVDGLVLVVDSTPERVQENLDSLFELRQTLAAYGRSISDLPIVVQYNKTDQADPNAIEELHRQLELPDTAAFESVATRGTGVLQALTTISKHVIRKRRDQPSQAPAPPAVAPPEMAPPIEAPLVEDDALPEYEVPAAQRLSEEARPLEAAILAEGEDSEEAAAVERTAHEADAAFHRPWEELAAENSSQRGARMGAKFEIVSVGNASRTNSRTVRVPLVLGNSEGETVAMALSISLDPLMDD